MISLGIAFFLLIILGAYLGKISEENKILNAFKMVIAGVVCIGLIILLQIEHI